MGSRLVGRRKVWESLSKGWAEGDPRPPSPPVPSLPRIKSERGGVDPPPRVPTLRFECLLIQAWSGGATTTDVKHEEHKWGDVS